MIGESAGTIEITERIEAPADIVFSYFTDSTRFVQWMGIGAELDPRPGGRYRIQVNDDQVASGEYREVEPPRRLLFTWGWEGNPSVPPDSTLVEITLVPDQGGTIVRLRHVGLPDEAARRLHAEGWTGYLKRLSEVARIA